MKWTEHADDTLRVLLENMVAESQLAGKVGYEVSPAQVVGASREMLDEIIRSGLPLARIMDTSDLVLHAEGPAVREDALKLSAVNWLTTTAESVIRRLSGSLFDLANKDAKRLSRELDLRLTGFARGSLYAGFSIAAPAADLLHKGDEPIFLSIRDAVRQLPEVPPMIRDEDINPQVRELIPDPAQRDTALTALFELAPTGRRGIHTIDISSPGIRSAGLSQRERVVLKDAIDRPQLHDRKQGTFVGELREIDLDARRFHLRNVQGIGGLRCITGNMDGRTAKQVIGEFVQVSGDYECDRDGKPRLMIVHDLKVLPRSEQAELLVQ